MLKEIINPRQNEQEKRRVFSDNYFDLYIWLDGKNSMTGFQLCYEKEGFERAVTWREGFGYSHEQVDAGEDISSGFKMKPMLVADGILDSRTVIEKYKEASTGVPEEINSFVLEKLNEYKL